MSSVFGSQNCCWDSDPNLTASSAASVVAATATATAVMLLLRAVSVLNQISFFFLILLFRYLRHSFKHFISPIHHFLSCVFFFSCLYSIQSRRKKILLFFLICLKSCYWIIVDFSRSTVPINWLFYCLFSSRFSFPHPKRWNEDWIKH